MAYTPDWQNIATQIEQVIKQPFKIDKCSSVSGGCINSSFVIQGHNQRFFIKFNQANLLPMFSAEFSGLNEIYHTKTITVPRPILFGISSNTAFLTLELIDFSSKTKQSNELLGHQLAALHQIKQPFFGWHRNNTIGSTEQINTRTDNWIEFWQQQRLGFQLSLAANNGYSKQLINSGEQLCLRLEAFFADYSPQPALLHGDLWGGNFSTSQQGMPVIYDPACYYGDRETDIAMTELFGGFDPIFYSAYNESYPLDTGYSIRKDLYNLYHILNHLNLFGSSYQSQAQQLIDTLLSEIS